MSALAAIADLAAIFSFCYNYPLAFVLTVSITAMLLTVAAPLFWIGKQRNDILSSDGQPLTTKLWIASLTRGYLWGRPRNRNLILVIVFILAAACFWVFFINSRTSNATKILIADLDQDCQIREKSPLKRRIRRELQDQAAKAGVQVDVQLLPDLLRPDEPRSAALKLLSSYRAHILIWGNYACTQTDVEMDVRVEVNLPDVAWKAIQVGGARQTGIAELNSMNLPKVTARSTTSIVLLLLAQIAASKNLWLQSRELSESAARSATESLRVAANINGDFDSAHERWLVASGYLLNGIARGQLGDWARLSKLGGNPHGPR